MADASWRWVHRQVNPLVGYGQEFVALDDEPRDGRVMLTVGNAAAGPGIDGLPRALLLTPVAVDKLIAALVEWRRGHTDRIEPPQESTP